MTLRTLVCTLALLASSAAFAALKAGEPAPAFTAPCSRGPELRDQHYHQAEPTRSDQRERCRKTGCSGKSSRCDATRPEADCYPGFLPPGDHLGAPDVV